MLGMSPCASMVERTIQINVAMTLEEERPQATVEMNASVDCLDVTSMKEVCDFTPKLCQTESSCSTCMQQDGCRCRQSNINFSMGVATSGQTKLSRYQKLNWR